MRTICKALLTLTFAIIPVLCLTVTAANALWCSLAVVLALLLSCTVRMQNEKIIPASVKDICIIIAVALGITLVEVFTEGALSADRSAAVFMPLCAVPTLLILGQTSHIKNVKTMYITALQIGAMFTSLMLIIGAIRELLGTGCLFGVTITRSLLDPLAVLSLPAGAIFVIAIFIAVLQRIAKEDEENA